MPPGRIVSTETTTFSREGEVGADGEPPDSGCEGTKCAFKFSLRDVDGAENATILEMKSAKMQGYKRDGFATMHA